MKNFPRLIFLGLISLSTVFSLLAEDDWMMKARSIDKESVKWLKDHLQKQLQSENFLKVSLEDEKTIPSTKSCPNCKAENISSIEETNLYVCMTFSLEDSLWVQLSKELEKLGGFFVVRGLPENSFKEFADKVFSLQEQGVTVPIQIHPKLFEDYSLHLVPTVMVVEGDKYDKISGNISIRYALEKMAQKGDTKQAEALYKRSSGQS